MRLGHQSPFMAFQSTLPGWGATGTIVSHDQGYYHFNPRSPDGERREADGDWPSGRQISIHAPRMGSDRRPSRSSARFQAYFNPRSPDGERQPRNLTRRHRCYFNPRSPDGERHSRPRACPPCSTISIHAPRMGSDLCRPRPPRVRQNFNPRSPDGERLVDVVMPAVHGEISIHAPRMGSDRCLWSGRSGGCHFNPRSPDGERL